MLQVWKTVVNASSLGGRGGGEAGEEHEPRQRGKGMGQGGQRQVGAWVKAGSEVKAGAEVKAEVEVVAGADVEEDEVGAEHQAEKEAVAVATGGRRRVTAAAMA